MPLEKVTHGKETYLWWKMYQPKKTIPTFKSKTARKPRFKIDDKVRVTYIQNPVERDYDENGQGKYLKCLNITCEVVHQSIEQNT